MLALRTIADSGTPAEAAKANTALLTYNVCSDLATSQDENGVKEDPYVRLERKETRLLRLSVTPHNAGVAPTRHSRAPRMQVDASDDESEASHSSGLHETRTRQGHNPDSSTRTARARRVPVDDSDDDNDSDDNDSEAQCRTQNVQVVVSEVDENECTGSASSVTVTTVTPSPASSLSFDGATLVEPAGMDIDEPAQQVPLKRSHDVDSNQTDSPSSKRQKFDSFYLPHLALSSLSYMASKALFASLLRRLKDSGHTLLAHSLYNREFCLARDNSFNTVELDSTSFLLGTYYVIPPNPGEKFCPVVFGEVKEIVTAEACPISHTASSDPNSLHTLCLSIGLPTGAWNEIDTLVWNQLSELDFVMRRDAADNDCLLPDADFTAYKNITRTVPWSSGPTGEASDRIFLNLSPQTKIVRSLPAHTVLSSRSPPLRTLPSKACTVLRDFDDIMKIVCLKPYSEPVETEDARDHEADGFADAVNFPLENISNPIQIMDYHQLSVGDFVLALCELLRIEYIVGDTVTRVYLLNVRGLNVVV
ncbi:hypothetical protein R3P38DRAFT_2815279 [Favolaschia claudopus]|uniref:Uncharacterized protein n=1 Tax=Favolaschia claudopus TaxID=2862362 RepID=A0AAV9Z1I6_9AGAR